MVSAELCCFNIPCEDHTLFRESHVASLVPESILGRNMGEEQKSMLLNRSMSEQMKGLLSALNFTVFKQEDTCGRCSQPKITQLLLCLKFENRKRDKTHTRHCLDSGCLMKPFDL